MVLHVNYRMRLCSFLLREVPIFHVLSQQQTSLRCSSRTGVLRTVPSFYFLGCLVRCLPAMTGTRVRRMKLYCQWWNEHTSTLSFSVCSNTSSRNGSSE